MQMSPIQLLEQLEHSYVLHAVLPPVFENNEMFWVGTSLSLAGVPLLVGAGELEEIVETPPCTSVPGTKPWVMGVASHKGGLLPIISSDALFQKKVYTGRAREYCMVIRRPGFHFGMTLSAIERDLKFPIFSRFLLNHVKRVGNTPETSQYAGCH